MKAKLIPFLVIAFLTLTSGSNACKDGDKDPGQEKEFSLDSFNGRFVQALSDAYEMFKDTDELPLTINVDGTTYDKAGYIAGACLLIWRISSSPDGWQETDIMIPNLSASSEDKWDTFEPDSVSFEEVKWLSGKIFDYALRNGRFPNFCTFPDKIVEPDGTEHDNRLTFNNSAVIFARLFNEYAARKGSFPSKISSWQSDFLRKTTNCETDSPVVLAAVRKAVSRKKSTYAKAEALYNYSRDEWEWVSNDSSVRGAAKTIEDKQGNCCDLAHGLLAMSRAAGIPARYVHAQCQYATRVAGHVYVEMYVDGKWHIGDASNNKNKFGTYKWKHMVIFEGRYKTLPF